MSKTKSKASEKLENEDILRAVVVADDFDDVFSVFLKNRCSSLLPLASKCILDYVLECLSQSGVQETIIFCSSKADVIKEYVRKSQWSHVGSGMKIEVMASEQCTSLGDALRDIDNKGLIKSDFILASTSSVSNINIQTALKYHKSQCKKDRGTTMTLILQDRGSCKIGEESIVAVNADTERLLVYVKQCSSPNIPISMEYIAENPRMKIYSCLKDTGIAVCSPAVPMLFSDNFDFQTKEDFIRGLLMNEEVMTSSIYCHVSSDYGHTVHDWVSYQRVTNDVVRRWTYPFVPDIPFGQAEPLVHTRGFVYKHAAVNMSKGCKLEGDVVIGDSSEIGSNVRLLRCVVGANCKIGDNVIIRDSYLMDNVTIEPCVTIGLSVLGEGVKVAKGSILKNCQLHCGVVLPENSDLTDKIIASKSSGDDCEKIGAAAFILSLAGSDSESDDGVVKTAAKWLRNPDEEDKDVEEPESESEAEESRPGSPEADDCSFFYSEVVESLQRGYEDRLSCSNLILEINSSRYAYNATLAEVTQYTSKAIFSLPSRLQCPAKPLLQFFKPLLDNYVKTEDGQRQCLAGLEEIYESLGNELNGCVHYLYDSDVLSEEIIDSWYDNLESDSPLKSKLSKFIQWLSEAAEESEDDEDDE